MACVGGVLRRGALLVLLVSASGWLAYRTARAQLSEQLLDWGKLALDVPSEWIALAPRTVMLNGARMRITTGRSDLPLSALLDSLQASCRRVSRIASDAQLGKRDALPSLADGVLRVDGGHEGVVACLELGDEPLGYRGVLARLTRFGETGDLQSLGAVRMARAQAREHGAFFVIASSEGSVPLQRMFPEHGDAPGFDPEGVERPSHARRLLSVWQENGEPTISIYESSRPLRESFGDYFGNLGRAGLELLASSPASDTAQAALFARAGHSYLVAGARRGQATLIAISALDQSEGASALRLRATP